MSNNGTRPITQSCVHCFSWHILRVKQRIANGTYQVLDYCVECENNANDQTTGGLFIPHSVAGDIDAMPLLKDNSLDMPPCEHCGSNNGVEFHHFAPSYIFPDPGQWPTAWLCRPCHIEWHKRMGTHPYKCLCQQAAELRKELIYVHGD